jgi:hypothetical protein
MTQFANTDHPCDVWVRSNELMGKRINSPGHMRMFRMCWDAASERAEKAEAALSQIREWIDGYDYPRNGMGSGMHQEMWPMLGPAARKRLREILEGVIP